MFEGQIQLIKKAKKILLLTHKDAGGDGDALGSLFGLSFALLKLDKEVHPFLNETISPNFSFLPGLSIFKNNIPSDIDLIIFLDLADLRRSSFPIYKNPSILVDHHQKGNLLKFSTSTIWDEKAASTTEILYFLINELGISIDKDIATCLLTGIFTDTNSFQNSNTTSRTLEVASSLLASGARLSKIAQHAFYEKPLPILRLWGRALFRAWKNEKYDLLITTLTSADFLECGVSEEGANGLANFLSLTSLPESQGILVLIEENGKIKGNLRAQKEGIDISKLAQVLGGGGHKKAAGFEIEGKLKIENREWKVV